MSSSLHLQGEHVPEAKVRKSRPASALAWHPTRKILAVGWETGELTIWNDSEHETYEVPLLHKGEITILLWTSNGTKLLTGDAVSLTIHLISWIWNQIYLMLAFTNWQCVLFSSLQLGLLILWKTDSRGRVQQTPLLQENLEEQIMQCVLRPPPPVDPAK